MELRGIELGPCLDASGLRGLDGTGYWFHHLPIVSKMWYDFTGSTPVGKTMTAFPTEGKMPLQKRYPFRPKEWFPKCIWVSHRYGLTINAVSLSNPGAAVLLRYSLPKVISFMATALTREGRMEELLTFIVQLQTVLASLPAGYELVLQINISCPNTAHDPKDLIGEATEVLTAASVLGIPLMLKVNVFASPAAVKEIAAHDACDALVCSNAVPFGAIVPEFTNQVDWGRYFPDGVSPLRKLGFEHNGGLSGAPLLPLVVEWLERVRDAGIDIPINAGGGILKPSDVDMLVHAGLRRDVDSVCFAAMAVLAPWNIKPVIRRAHELLG